jgi:hypothetical protein
MINIELECILISIYFNFNYSVLQYCINSKDFGFFQNDQYDNLCQYRYGIDVFLNTIQTIVSGCIRNISLILIQKTSVRSTLHVHVRPRQAKSENENFKKETNSKTTMVLMILFMSFVRMYC